MYQVRRSESRGHGRHGGWLESRHSFSFADYYDPDYMGVSTLRVINDDQVAPGAGFPTHGHRDMEIISYVLDGALEHKDSMGNGSVISPGEVQLMSAGKGVTHSEFNASGEDPVRFLQIWIQPDKLRVDPSYQQHRFDPADAPNGAQLLVSPDGAEGSLRIHQDARVYRFRLTAGQTQRQWLGFERTGYLHLVRGRLQTLDGTLDAGDGLTVAHEQELVVTAATDVEALWFDLP